ncbi:IS1595 family transposase [Parvularcula marina]|uniref:IS1595 family transposase n=1 Tax=Parvularcula marina TaxID=2292771 RepID=UPI003510D563
MLAKFDSLFDLMDAIPDEQAAIDHFRAIRWKNGAFCPHCRSTKVYHFTDNRTHKCGDCRKRFSIKVGTIFEDSKIALRKWMMAIWLITSHKKGIASTQLAKDIKVTQKTAWFMLHRLRHAARTQSFNRPLDGEVEADETYVGGKTRNMHAKKRKTLKALSNKTAVMGLQERGGELRATVLPNRHKDTIQGEVRANVSRTATLITDEAQQYKSLKDEYRHETVCHNAGEYVRDDIHTNSIEAAWALLKRQIIGIHHWVSAKHLDQYVGEMVWRYNRRSFAEGERMNHFLSSTEGRLTYKALIA